MIMISSSVLRISLLVAAWAPCIPYYEAGGIEKQTPLQPTKMPPTLLFSSVSIIPPHSIIPPSDCATFLYFVRSEIGVLYCNSFKSPTTTHFFPLSFFSKTKIRHSHLAAQHVGDPTWYVRVKDNLC